MDWPEASGSVGGGSISVAPVVVAEVAAGEMVEKVIAVVRCGC